MSKIIKITTFFMFFVMCFCVQNALAENCTTVGATQNKYTANTSACDYSTQTRTCCNSKAWSDWGKECCNKTAQNCDDNQLYAGLDKETCMCICPEGAIEVNGTCECDEANGWEQDGHECIKSFCTSSQCWTGSYCANKETSSRNCVGNIANASGGTQGRSGYCVSGKGWQYTWSGTCTCTTGYCWDGSSCSAPVTTRSCSSIDYHAGGTQTRTATSCGSSGWKYTDWVDNCWCEYGYEWNGSSCDKLPTYYWDCTNHYQAHGSACQNSHANPGRECYVYGLTDTGYEYDGDLCIVSDCTCR